MKSNLALTLRSIHLWEEEYFIKNENNIIGYETAF